MVLTNEINFTINYDKFFEKYDVYYIKCLTDYSKKIPNYLRGQFKALSIFYTYGKTMYVMYNKGEVTLDELKGIVNDDTVEVALSGRFDNDDWFNSIILNLSLNSLNNFRNEKLIFNNLTGSLYLFDNSSVKTKIKAYDISFKIGKSKPYSMNVSATSFIKYNPKYPTYDLYELTNTNGLKAVLNPKDATGELFTKKKGNKNKTTSKFYDLNNLDRATVYHQIMRKFKEKFYGIIDIDFVSREYEKVIRTLKGESPKKSEEKKKAMFISIAGRIINVVSNIDISNDKKYDEHKIASILNGFITQLKQDGFEVDFNKKTTKYPLNIVINHNADYYESEFDPYKGLNRNTAVQCVTIETLESIFKSEKPSLNSYYVILKDLSIKHDLIYNKRISLDKWEDRRINTDYIFGMFADDNKSKIAYLKVKTDGSIETYYDDMTLFNMEKIEKIKTLLKEDNAEYFIMDSDDNVNIVSMTDIIVLPTEKILEEKQKNKDFKNDYMEGIFDVHSYNIDGELYYTSGTKDNIKFDIDKATHFYKVNTLGGKNLFVDLLETVAVDFVRFGNYTVLPYPFKYLREYTNLIK